MKTELDQNTLATLQKIVTTWHWALEYYIDGAYKLAAERAVEVAEMQKEHNVQLVHRFRIRKILETAVRDLPNYEGPTIDDLCEDGWFDYPNFSAT